MAQVTWQCKNCGIQYKWSTVPTPKSGGPCRNNPSTQNHVWEKIG